MSNNKITTFQRVNKFLEYFWLAISGVSAILAGWFIYNEGYDEAKWYLLFPLLALAMYFMRRGLRKKFEANIRQQQEAQEQSKGKHKK